MILEPHETMVVMQRPEWEDIYFGVVVLETPEGCPGAISEVSVYSRSKARRVDHFFPDPREFVSVILYRWMYENPEWML